MSIMQSKDLIAIIQETFNNIDNRLIDHGQRVAYIVNTILKHERCYEDNFINDMTMLAFLHDIGAYKTEEIDKMVIFETNNIWKHSIYGYLFLKYMSPLSIYANIILYHHAPCNEIKIDDPLLKDMANLINLADRIDIYMTNAKNPKALSIHLEKNRDIRFFSNILDMYLRVDQDEDILGHIFDEQVVHSALDSLEFHEELINDYLRMISFAIDFRSSFMVSHTICTTSIAIRIAQLMKLNPATIHKIEYGALLHDIGKVAIPIAILESTNKLSNEDMNVMKSHVLHTNHILNGHIDSEVKDIAVHHHEKLDGSGYPFGLHGEQLSISERIVTVADILSALCGRRSYKDIFDKITICEILQTMVDGGTIDQEVVAIVIYYYENIMQFVDKHCTPLLAMYTNIGSEYDAMVEKLNR